MTTLLQGNKIKVLCSNIETSYHRFNRELWAKKNLATIATKRSHKIKPKSMSFDFHVSNQ